MSLQTIALLALGFVVVKLVDDRKRSAVARGRLPPGPKGLPIIGNLHQVPQGAAWITYAEWAKEYGDITYLDAMGQPIVVINTMEACQELLVRRAGNYSDRPSSAVQDLLGLSWSLPLMPYGNYWREHRRSFHQFFHLGQVSQFNPIVEEEIKVYLRHLLETPKDFIEHAKLFYGSVLTRISYGQFDEPGYARRLIHLSDAFLRDMFEYLTPGRLLVGLLPSLRHVPSWLPGAGWKRTLLRLTDESNHLLESPFGDSIRKTTSEKGVGEDISVVKRLVEHLPDQENPRYTHHLEVARNVAAISYMAGSDTMISTGLALIAALILYPDVQAKAYREVQSVTRGKRLPVAGDLEDLPYIQATIKETVRWHTAVPLCLPHSSLEDDYYKGHLIPKGAIIIPNSWALMHDPAVFGDPMEFRPERYLKDGKLNSSIRDPEAGAFGYGRRKCPGRHLSNNVLALTVASLLTVFEIRPSLDENGKSTLTEMKTDTKLLITPEAFERNIVPRSSVNAELLLNYPERFTEHPFVYT